MYLTFDPRVFSVINLVQESADKIYSVLAAQMIFFSVPGTIFISLHLRPYVPMVSEFNYALLDSTPFQMQMIIYQSSQCINDKRDQFR